MRVNTHACDACAAQRKVSNHWYKVHIAVDKSYAAIRVWEDTIAPSTPLYFAFDACGLPHAYQIISKYLEPDSKNASQTVVEEKER